MQLRQVVSPRGEHWRSLRDPGDRHVQGRRRGRSGERVDRLFGERGNRLVHGAGECVITFNDPGNATYGPAPQITENITVDAANVITVTDPKTEGGVDGVYEPVVTATSGDTVTRALAASSTGCTLKAEKVTFEKQGTCVIIFSDPSTGAFAAATPVTEKLTIYAVNFIHTSVSPRRQQSVRRMRRVPAHRQRTQLS